MHGLRNSRKNPYFETYLSSFDIVALLETWTTEDVEFADFMPAYTKYVLHGVRRSSFGRTPGGVSVHISPAFADKVVLVQKIDYGMIFRMSKQHFNQEKDIIWCFVYVPYDKSTFYDNRECNDGIMDFYLTVLDIIPDIVDCDIVIAGDLNARTGTLIDYIEDDNIGDFIPHMDWYPSDNFDISRNSCDTFTNSFGYSLIDICKQLGIHFLNGRTPGDAAGEYTFCSTTGKSVIDYFVVSSHLFSFIKNFYVDVNDQSDHYPLVCMLEYMSIKQTVENQHEETNNRNRLKWDPKYKDKFQNLLIDDYSVQQFNKLNEHLNRNNIDVSLDIISGIIYYAASDMIQPLVKSTHINPVRQNAPWWDDECQHNKRTKEYRLRVYRRSHSEVDLKNYIASKAYFKCTCRKKEQSYQNNLKKSLDDSHNDMSKFWSLMKSLKPNTVKPNITTTEWYEYFSGLLSIPKDRDDIACINFNSTVENYLLEHDSTCDLCITNSGQPYNVSLHVLNDDITQDEISNVIKILPNGKSSGLDGMPYEIFINSLNLLLPHLCKLFNVILSTGNYPSTWSEAMISPLHKKGSINKASNYRGISLLCTLGKIFTKILNNRLTLWADANDIIDESQAAYRKGRSTVDHMFILFGITQKYLSKQGGRFYCTFVDFSRAFDSIPHGKLFYRMINIGIHGKILTVLRSMYSKLKSCIKTPNGITKFFNCEIGTRQGCMISPLLFIMYLNELIAMFRRSNCPGIYLNENEPSLQALMYADDICIFNDTIGRLQLQLNVLSQFCKEYDLDVNLDKTNIVVFRNGGRIKKNENVFYKHKKVNHASYYKYLGITFSSTLKWSSGLNILSKQALKACLSIYNLYKYCGDIPVKTSLLLFDKVIVPILICYFQLIFLMS